MTKIHRRGRATGRSAWWALAAAVLVAGSSVLATTPAVAEYPSRPITKIVAFSPGGGTDVMARVMAGYLQEELGQPVTVENRPGGNAMLAHTYFLQQPADGHTILVTVAMPYFAVNRLVQGAQFEVDDFAFINLPRQDYVLVATRPDSDFDTAGDMVEYIRENPGNLTIGSNTPGSADYINLMLFLDALGIAENDVRIVNYPGGNDVRLGLLTGDVDVIFVGGLTSLPAADQLKPLMVFRNDPAPGWDAPTHVEVMTELGVEPVYISGALGGFAVHASFRDENPEAWEALVGAFERITNDPERVAAMQGQQLPTEWIGPDAARDLILNTYAVLEQHTDLIEGN